MVKPVWTLRLVIPLMILACGLSILFVQYLVATLIGIEDTRKAAEDEVRLMGLQLAHLSGFLLNHDESKFLKQILISNSRESNAQLILIIDEQGIIIETTEDELRGASLISTIWAEPFESLLGKSTDGAELKEIRRTADGDILSAVFRIVNADSYGTDSAPHQGWIGIVYDLQKPMSDRLRRVATITLFSALLVMLSALLFWYVMTRILDRPMKKLLLSTRAIAAGDFTVSSNLRRVNELGEISEALDTLAQVSADRARAVESNKQLAEIIEVVRVGVSITDASSDDYPLVYVNKTLCDMTGYARNELIGQGVRILQRATPQQNSHDEIVEAQRNGQPVQVLLESTRKDGSTYMDELSLTPFYNENGQLTHYIGINRDVTDKLDTENRLRLSQRLEAIGQLSGGIAHDFNNLLSVISGNLELLQRETLQENQHELLKEAENAAQMGARLTRRLLTFAKQSESETSVVNLNDLVLSVSELLRSIVGDSVTLSTRLSSNPWPIRVDPSEVENTIINLAINARDAMGQGGRLLIDTANMHVGAELAAELEINPGKYVKLNVSDTGSGMSPEVVSHAFEPFFTTKEQGKGTGLGLSTIYGFARQSGGQVVIATEMDSGTVISLYLPRCQELPAAVLQRVAPIECLEPSPGRCVLIVEDNESVRKVTQKRINALGYDSIPIENGKQAIDWFSNNTSKQKNIDIVFSDVVMDGGVSGYDLANWVQEHLPNCHIVLTSGYHEYSVANEKSIVVLQKPYTMAELEQALAFDEW